MKMMKKNYRKMEEIIYRKAVTEDCHELSILKRDVWNTTYQGIYPQEKLDNYDVQKNEEILKGIVLNPEIDLYVAQKQKKLLGFMTCGKPYRLFNEYNQEVALLYILKEFQRRGIGRHFIELAKEETRKKGFDEFILSVNSKNENAIAFYLAMGGIIICDDGGQKRFLFKV